MADRPGCSRSAVYDELFMLLSRCSISIISKEREHSVLVRAVCLHARHDACVKLSEYYGLENALCLMCRGNVSIEWISGGHIAATFVKPARLLIPAILCALNHDKILKSYKS